MSDAPDKIDINRATQDALSNLPGIGPALAGRIVAYRSAVRPFETVDDLTNVPGISQRMVAAMAERVHVLPAEPEVPEPVVRWETLGDVAEKESAAVVGEALVEREPAGSHSPEEEVEPLPDLEEAAAAELEPDAPPEHMPAPPAPEMEPPEEEGPAPDAARPPEMDDVAAVAAEETEEPEIIMPLPTEVAEAVPAVEAAPTLAAPEEEEGREPEVPPAVPERSWRGGCATVAAALLGAVLGAVATLIVLAALNGGALQYAPASNVEEVEALRGAQLETTRSVGTVEAELETVQNGLESDLSTMESELATAQAAGVENDAALGTVAADAARLEATIVTLRDDIDQIDAVADDFDMLVNGLRDLLDNLESVSEPTATFTPTPTPTPTPEPAVVEPTPTAPTPTARPTRTPRPSATPFLTPTPAE